jgi:hypothetical protein
MSSKSVSNESGAVASLNAALNDEVAALNSIYGVDTLVVQQASADASRAVLRLPESDISFLLQISSTYPDSPPDVLGTQSIGLHGRKGQGDAASTVLRDVLARVWAPGQVCLFDVIEGAGPLLAQEDEDFQPASGAAADLQKDTPDRSGTPENELLVSRWADDAAAVGCWEPDWTQSEPLTFNKSTFIAHACKITSIEQAQDSISHLLSTNKKVASATHNISAWRIKTPPQACDNTSRTAKNGTAGDVIIQDCDDDGETAAGGRLLHLMQLMDVWNVLVVVTRWYGGVKLGPDRFRLINQVARDVLVKAGFSAPSKEDSKSKSGSKAKGKG